jgi:hypothetical protein
MGIKKQHRILQVLPPSLISLISLAFTSLTHSTSPSPQITSLSHMLWLPVQAVPSPPPPFMFIPTAHHDDNDQGNQWQPLPSVTYLWCPSPVLPYYYYLDSFVDSFRTDENIIVF